MPHHQPGPVRPRHGVLITRAAGAAAGVAERVRALGLDPVLTPLLVVRTVPVAWPGRVDAVLLTSGNAVPALAGGPPGPGVPVLAVGDATAALARAAGAAAVESAGGDAAALLALARRRLPRGARLLLASGSGQGAALAAGLRGAGFMVHRRVVYAAVPVGSFPAAAAAAVAGGGLGAALFLSADTARCFARLLPAALRPALGGVEALAIGPAAAAALAPLPWRRVRVSVGPTLDQVLALL